ncbi:MATE family efflux transporter [Holdemanella porci]|nr:MATE family efflux transporter [Holdemanella porci]MBU9871153.1 MATE family efflux transporter [Holdemanella porci]MBU9886340.1 MATE family efflux transporter [Holdemanella porci]
MVYIIFKKEADLMKNHSLTQGSIAKGLLFFVIPLFFSNLFQQLYNTIDTLLVGHFLGDNALAAMGATAAIFELIVQFSNGCGTGFSIVTARYYGSKNENELKKSVAASLILGLIISIVITIVSYVSMPYLLTILKTPKSIYHDSLNYIRCISAFLIITMFYNLGAGMLRAIGDSLRPLIVLFCSSIINIALDIVCITILDMGVFGAAVATVIAQVISTIICFFLILRKAKILMPRKEHFQIKSYMINDLLGQGFSMGFMFSIVSIGTIILQSGINSLGTQIITAHTAARKLISLFCLPLSTLAASMATFVSQNKGAQNYERIIKGVRLSNICGIIYPIFLSILIYFTAENLVHLLSGSNTHAVLQNGAMYLKINIPFFIVLSILLNLRNAIQGFGYKITPLFSSIIELIGKIVFTLFLVPTFKYLGVCFCEPIIWCLMASQLIYSYQKIIKPFKAQNY